MGLLDSFRSQRLPDVVPPTRQDLFRWRCPRCSDELSFTNTPYPGPGDEEMFFSKHWCIVHKNATSTCGYQFGIKPSYVYVRCGLGHISAFKPETVGSSRPIPWKCSDCGDGSLLQAAQIEPAVLPVYFEKLTNYEAQAVQRSGSNPMRPALSGMGGRVTYRRFIQTADGIAAEELIIEG